MVWLGPARGWVAEPEEVMGALSHDGFQEVKYETARLARRPPAGGVWQGLNPRTGAVASAIWVARAQSERPLMSSTSTGPPSRDDRAEIRHG